MNDMSPENSAINAIMPALKSPLALLYGVIIMGAFALSAHIQGYEDIYYLPANMLLVLAALIAIFPVFRNGLSIPATWPVFLVLAFWSFIAFSMSWSSVPYASLLMFAMFCALPVTFFGIILSPAREKILAGAGLFLGFSALLLAGSALLQHFITGGDYGQRAHFPYANPNNLAALFNMALLPALCFYLYSGKGLTGRLCYLLTLIFFAALLATESRGALLSFGITGLIVLLFSWPSPHSGLKKAAALAAGLTAVILVFYLASPSSFLSERFLQGFAASESSSLGQRFMIWQAALTMAMERPLTGTGYGTFFLYYPAYRLAGDTSSLGFWTHMDPLQFWTEMGFLAPLLFYSVAAAVLIRTIKALKATPRDSRPRTFIWAGFSALLALFLHSHLTFNLYIMSLLLVTGYMLAVWYTGTHHALGNGFVPVASRFYRYLTAFIFTAFVFLVMFSSFNAASGPYFMKQALREKAVLNMESYLALLGKADRWSPSSFIAPETEVATHNINALERPEQSISVSDRETIIRRTQSLLDEATYWNPVWPRIDVLKARLALIQDQTAGASAALHRALAKNPSYFEANQALFMMYMEQGLVDDAARVLQTALEYPRAPYQTLYYRTRLEEVRTLQDIKARHERRENLYRPIGPPETVEGSP